MYVSPPGIRYRTPRHVACRVTKAHSDEKNASHRGPQRTPAPDVQALHLGLPLPYAQCSASHPLGNEARLLSRPPWPLRNESRPRAPSLRCCHRHRRCCRSRRCRCRCRCRCCRRCCHRSPPSLPPPPPPAVPALPLPMVLLAGNYTDSPSFNNRQCRTDRPCAPAMLACQRG